MPNDSLDEALDLASYDPDPVIVIDNNLRTMNQKGPILLGVYNDMSVHTLSFELPRHYDSVDLKTFQIRVNIENADGARSAEEVSNIKSTSDKITFDWVLKKIVFEKAGTVKFNVCLKRFSPSGELLKEFNTTINTGTVLEGLEIDDIGKQAVLYRLKELRDKSASSTVIVGSTAFTYTQLSDLVTYLDT